MTDKFIKRTCMFCQKKFIMKKADLANRPGKFCSRGCIQRNKSKLCKERPRIICEKLSVADIKRKKAERLKIWAANNPEKVAAHSAVSAAIKSGKLKRMPCVECGKIKSHAHHSDYSKPLDVIWLCSEHHHGLHRKLRGDKVYYSLKRERQALAARLSDLDIKISLYEM